MQVTPASQGCPASFGRKAGESALPDPYDAPADAGFGAGGFRAGWLQLSFLEVAGKKTAGYINFDYDNHIWVYNSGLDFGYRELSPGWVLLGYLLQWANEDQRGFFDFMRGDEEYKYRFGAIDRRVMRVKIQRGG